MGPNQEIKISDYALSDLHDVMRTLTSVAMAAWIAPGMGYYISILDQLFKYLYRDSSWR